jgi:hypothetical protein
MKVLLSHFSIEEEGEDPPIPVESFFPGQVDSPFKPQIIRNTLIIGLILHDPFCEMIRLS